MTPHVPLVLKTIYQELAERFKTAPKLIWIRDDPTTEDLDHIFKQGAVSEFDQSNLKKSMLDDLRQGKAKLITKSCAIAKLLIIAYPEQESLIPWKDISNIFRAFGVKQKPWRVVWFANPTPRLLPPSPQEPEAKHMNGGYTMRCDPSTIVIYREEEFLRVLVHELLHAGCTDSPHDSVEMTEAKTESWAELFLIAILYIEKPRLLKQAWNIQAQWIADQEEVLRTQYGVNSPEDYAWRYTVARRSVLEGVGVELPVAAAAAAASATGNQSMRFTSPFLP